jgi:hypothetical protein
MPATPDDANKHLQRIRLTDEERRLLMEVAERSDPLSDSQPIPQAIQRELRKSFTTRQLVVLAIKAGELRSWGFGNLVIHFLKHRPKFIETSESEDID